MPEREMIAAVKNMISAGSCCADLRTAGEKFLAALGTDGENAALDALLAEVKEDVCTLDHTIPFFESPRAAEIFGAEKAKALAAHARERKAQGEVWCDCPACDAGVKLLELAKRRELIRLNCFYLAKDGRLAEALAAAKALTAASQKQDGCIAYDVFESATRPGVLLICETWRDDRALADHMASAPFVKYAAVLNDAGTLKIERFGF